MLLTSFSPCLQSSLSRLAIRQFLIQGASRILSWQWILGRSLFGLLYRVACLMRSLLFYLNSFLPSYLSSWYNLKEYFLRHLPYFLTRSNTLIKTFFPKTSIYFYLFYGSPSFVPILCNYGSYYGFTHSFLSADQSRHHPLPQCTYRSFVRFALYLYLQSSCAFCFNPSIVLRIVCNALDVALTKTAAGLSFCTEKLFNTKLKWCALKTV